jgi:uncharacterized repeat protein (TIGR01451 family)
LGVSGRRWCAKRALGVAVLVSLQAVAQADLVENFDAGTALPAGWVNGGSGHSTMATHYNSPPYARSLAAGQWLQTPSVDYPTNLSFYVDASNAGNGKTATVDYSLDGGATWTLLAGFAVSTAGSTRNFPLVSSPNLSASAGVRFRFNSTFATWYLDDVLVQTGSSPFSDVPPTLRVEPAETNRLVLTGEEVRIEVRVAETDGDEITLTGIDLPAGSVFDPNPLMGTAPLTNVFAWTPIAPGAYTMAFVAEDKDGEDRIHLTLTVYETDPTLLLFEDFDASTEVQPGWINDGTLNQSDVAHYSSAPNCRAMRTGTTLVTPPVDYPTNLSFYVDASNAGNGQTAWVEYRIGEGEWIALGSFVVRTTGAIESFNLLNLPDYEESPGVQFRFSSTFMTWYLDDVLVRGGQIANQPPRLAPIGPQMVAPGQTLSVEVSALDYDGHEIALTASNLPPGAVFDATTGVGSVSSVLVFAPQESDVGETYETTFTAEDVDGATSETVEIAVYERLVGFALAGAEALESAGEQRVAVVLSSPADVTVEVSLGGNATPGVEGDYEILATNLIFTADGSTTQYLEVAIFDDDEREGPETIVLALTNAVGAHIGPIGTHVLTILDNDVVFLERFDSDPGWSTQGAWAFGRPLGGGGAYGYPDPTSGYTGTNVYGYNLAGDYPNNMAVTLYLTTPAIDCSRFRNVRLEFWRWLGVEYSIYDQACIQISTDRRNWTDVWRHNGGAITDSQWTRMSYDIAAVADGQSSVYIRWGMGPTDYAWNYCGWNIDDVSLEGEAVTNALFRFSAAQYVVREGAAAAEVVVQRMGLTDIEASIRLATVDGTATAGEDYEAIDEVLTFDPGERSRTVWISLLDDVAVEGDETIHLSLIPTGSGDVAEPSAAMLVIQDDESPGAALPFFDGFESGGLASDWTATSTGAGRIRVDAGYDAPFEGMRQACLDTTQYNRYGLNELILTVDLSGQTNAVLDFQEANYDYEAQPMPEWFQGSVNADGVAISADGWNWYRIVEMPRYGYSYGYTNRVLSLSALAAANGLAADSHFKIKFQQYDRYPLPTYGRCFDNVQVYDPAQVADIRLSVVESEDPVLPGTELVYALVVSNAGPLAAEGVVASNRIPAGLELVSATSSQGECIVDGDGVAASLGALAKGGFATVWITVATSEPGSITNWAQAWSDGFDPYRTNNGVESVTVVDERGGTLEWELESAELQESAGTVRFHVVRTGPTYGEISVGYATADGTAVAGQDYAAASGRLVLASGQTRAFVDIVIINDSLDEPTETFTISLFDPDGGAELGERIQMVLSILDDDGAAAFPFHESFESGALTNYWRTYSSGLGQIAITTNHAPQDGEFHAAMDAAGWGTASLNELVLTVDLAGKQGVTLSFWHRKFDDYPHTMPATFSGHHNSDGVAISANGTNWVKVQGLTTAEGASNGYVRFEVALDPIVAARGLTYTSTFKIKFQQFDYYPIPWRGAAFDNLSLFARPGEFRFSSSAYSVGESGGEFTVNVERVNGSLGEATVHVATADGTATAGLDYVPTNGILAFADGVTTGAFVVAILEDDLDEPTETVLLTLSDPTGGTTLAAPSNAVLSIQDNDGPGIVVLGADSYTAGEGDGSISIPVLRLGGADGEVSVEFSAAGGTATDGLDFAATNGVLIFADGVVSQSFAIVLFDDDEFEETETVLIALGSPTGGASIGEPSSAILYLFDDEDPHYEYYRDAHGKTGTALRESLNGIIGNNSILTYDTIWAVLQDSDECPTNSLEVLLAYMQKGRDKFNNGGSLGQWNREHVWPQSRGFPGGPAVSIPPSVDAHNLKPTDVYVNGQRGNKVFERGGNPVAGTPETCRTTSTTFEPPDASKGDVARILFYMDVRYAGGKANEPNLELVDSVEASGAQMGKLSTLIEWHFQDPPDDFEQRRNERIHAWQGNRNPFIDHPEWVLEIWDYTKAIATLAGQGGSIAPENPHVRYHSGQRFEIQPAPYWTIADVRTNGVSLGADYGSSSYAFVWSPVVATGLVEAVFAPDLAPLGTPLWWLAEQGFDGDFALAELGDPDEDGMPTWKEFLANTDPKDDRSLLQFEHVQSDLAAGETVLRWQSASNRTYSIWRSAHLPDGFAHRIATNLPAHPPVNAYTDAVDNAEALFYRIEVAPAPP